MKSITSYALLTRVTANLKGVIDRVLSGTRMLMNLTRKQHLLLKQLPFFSSLVKLLAKRLNLGSRKIVSHRFRTNLWKWTIGCV